MSLNHAEMTILISIIYIDVLTNDGRPTMTQKQMLMPMRLLDNKHSDTIDTVSFIVVVEGGGDNCWGFVFYVIAVYTIYHTNHSR